MSIDTLVTLWDPIPGQTHAINVPGSDEEGVAVFLRNGTGEVKLQGERDVIRAALEHALIRLNALPHMKRAPSTQKRVDFATDDDPSELLAIHTVPAPPEHDEQWEAEQAGTDPDANPGEPF